MDRGAEHSNKNSFCLRCITVHFEVHGEGTGRTNSQTSATCKNAMRAYAGAGCRSGRHVTRRSTLVGYATAHHLDLGVAGSLLYGTLVQPTACCLPSQLDAGHSSPVAAQARTIGGMAAGLGRVSDWGICSTSDGLLSFVGFGLKLDGHRPRPN